LIRAALFDYGGTLVTPEKSWPVVKTDAINAVFQLLGRHGLIMPQERFLALNDSLFERYEEQETREDKDIADKVKYKELMGELFPELTEGKRNRLAIHANGAFWGVAQRNFKLSSGARGCLKMLRSKGIKMAVVSNHHNYDSLITRMKQIGIRDYFQAVIASEKVGVRKPNPEIFEMALDRLRVRKEYAVFVGDSLETDIAGAKKVGLVAILMQRRGPSLMRKGSVHTDSSQKAELSPAKAEPDLVIENLTGLKKALSSSANKLGS
jgi:putative hydrolase of the HAD superfamily